MLTQSPETLGQGKLWAIHQAQQLVGLSVAEGLVRCEGHAAVGQAVFDAVQHDTKKSDARTVTRFGSGTNAIITAWLESDGEALPPTHPDFGIDLRGRTYERNDGMQLLVSDFDPDAVRITTAINRLRVVRLALPEVLRTYKPEVSEVSDRLAGIISALGSASYHTGREPQRPDYGRFGFRF